MLSSWLDSELLPALSETLASRIRVTYLQTQIPLCPESELLASQIRVACVQSRLPLDLKPLLFAHKLSHKIYSFSQKNLQRHGWSFNDLGTLMYCLALPSSLGFGARYSALYRAAGRVELNRVGMANMVSSQGSCFVVSCTKCTYCGLG